MILLHNSITLLYIFNKLFTFNVNFLIYSLKRACRLLCYCLTIFPPSESFAPHLAWWIRQEPMKSLGAASNLNGLLARSCIVGHVKPSDVPRCENFDATGRISYTKHWVSIQSDAGAI